MNALKEQNVEFIFIKATEGNSEVTQGGERYIGMNVLNKDKDLKNLIVG